MEGKGNTRKKLHSNFSFWQKKYIYKLYCVACTDSSRDTGMRRKLKFVVFWFIGFLPSKCLSFLCLSTCDKFILLSDTWHFSHLTEQQVNGACLVEWNTGMSYVCYVRCHLNGSHTLPFFQEWYGFAVLVLSRDVRNRKWTFLWKIMQIIIT